MADIKISQLGAAVAVSDTDVLPLVNSANPATTNKVTAETLKEYVIGDTDISAIGDGSATGAISALKSGKTEGTAISENIETIGSTAIDDYASGDTFLASNGNYYEATAAITGGTTTLTVGTNCKLSTVNEQLASLKEALTTEIDNVNDSASYYSAKNLCPNNTSSQVIGGVTFTRNSDGTVTVNGTNTSGNDIFYSVVNSNTFNTPTATYYINGCPVGLNDNGNKACIGVKLEDTWVYSTPQADFGQGGYFVEHSVRGINIRVFAGATLNYALFKPMLTILGTKDHDYDDYVPYAMTNSQLTEFVKSRGTYDLLLRDQSYDTAEKSSIDLAHPITDYTYIVILANANRNIGPCIIMPPSLIAINHSPKYLYHALAYGNSGGGLIDRDDIFRFMTDTGVYFNTASNVGVIRAWNNVNFQANLEIWGIK